MPKLSTTVLGRAVVHAAARLVRTFVVVTTLWLLIAVAFGALDQYVGSFSAHPWGADISGLSAPWLVLPFVFGATQSKLRRSVLLGLSGTILALVGYMLMTFSPLENAHLTLRGLLGFLQGGNVRWFAAGMVTGPVFAWLGYRWRVDRALAAGLVVAVVICLEPWVRHEYGNVIRSPVVTVAEMAAGACFAVVVAVRAAMAHRWRAAG